MVLKLDVLSFPLASLSPCSHLRVLSYRVGSSWPFPGISGIGVFLIIFFSIFSLFIWLLFFAATLFLFRCRLLVFVLVLCYTLIYDAWVVGGFLLYSL